MGYIFCVIARSDPFYTCSLLGGMAIIFGRRLGELGGYLKDMYHGNTLEIDIEIEKWNDLRHLCFV